MQFTVHIVFNTHFDDVGCAASVKPQIMSKLQQQSKIKVTQHILLMSVLSPDHVYPPFCSVALCSHTFHISDVFTAVFTR